jgi:hypothetical protein
VLTERTDNGSIQNRHATGGGNFLGLDWFYICLCYQLQFILDLYSFFGQKIWFVREVVYGGEMAIIMDITKCSRTEIEIPN